MCKFVLMKFVQEKLLHNFVMGCVKIEKIAKTIAKLKPHKLKRKRLVLLEGYPSGNSGYSNGYTMVWESGMWLKVIEYERDDISQYSQAKWRNGKRKVASDIVVKRESDESLYEE